MSTLQTEIAYTVDTIAADVARWSASQKNGEYTVRKLPIHLVLFPLVQRIGGEYVVVGTETAIVIKRRAVTVKYGNQNP